MTKSKLKKSLYLAYSSRSLEEVTVTGIGRRDITSTGNKRECVRERTERTESYILKACPYCTLSSLKLHKLQTP